MTKRKDVAYSLVLAVACLVYRTGASDDTVTVDGTACGQSYSIDHGDAIDVKWNGTDLPYNCSVGFSAPDNKSTICMEVEQFLIYQCVFEIQVKDNNKTYDCNTTVIGEEYCISSQQTVYLDFIYSYTGTITSSQEVTILVKVNEEEEEESGFNAIFIVFIVAGVFSGVCFCVVKIQIKKSIQQNRSTGPSPASNTNARGTNAAPAQGSTNPSSSASATQPRGDPPPQVDQPGAVKDIPPKDNKLDNGWYLSSPTDTPMDTGRNRSSSTLQLHNRRVHLHPIARPNDIRRPLIPPVDPDPADVPPAHQYVNPLPPYSTPDANGIPSYAPPPFYSPEAPPPSYDEALAMDPAQSKN